MKPLPLIAAAAVVAFAVLRRRRLGKLELSVAALVAAGLVVYGTGLVEPPNLEELLLDIGKKLGPYTYVLVGALAFLETGAFIGLVAPGETAIIVGGVVAGQGEISIVALIAIVWGCAVAGDVTSFFLGRRLGRQFLVRHGPRFKITEDRLQQVERFFERHGGKAIFLGRFVGVVRAMAPFIAGSSGMRFRRFLPYDVLGAGVWGTTFALLGYFFWESFDRVASYASRGALALGSVIALGAGGVYAYRWVKEPEHRDAIDAWLDRHRRLRAAVRLAGRVAHFAGNRLTIEVATLLAIIAVGGFTFYALEHAVGAGPTRSDLRAANVAAQVRGEPGVAVAKAVSFCGGIAVVAVAAGLAALALLWRRRPIDAVALAAGLGVTWLAVAVARAVVDRPRPAGGIVATDGASFPSGHAAYAVTWLALVVALARVLPGAAGRVGALVAAIALAGAVGVSRVELRANYYTDVLAGWGMGAAVFALCGLAGLIVARLRFNESST